MAALRPEFPDRLPGTGGRGAQTTAPLVLKWAACTQILVEGCLVKTAARQAHMDEDFLNKWFKRAFDFLSRCVVPEHVYTPRDEAELRRVDWDVEELGALIESARRASCALEARERCDRAEHMLLLLKQRHHVVCP